MFQWGRIIASLIIPGLVLPVLCTPVAQADDISVRYEILNSVPRVDGIHWDLKLQLSNLSGEEINRLSINVITPDFTPSSNDGAVVMENLPATAPQTFLVTWVFPDEYGPQGEIAFKFYLSYETPDGIERSAVVQGQPSAFIGESMP